MRAHLPYICEGEIYEIQEHLAGPRKPIRYICKVELSDGSTILVPNVAQSTMFGGIDDYVQHRARTSADSGADVETSSTDEKNAAQIGDRVYVAFVGGNIQKPVIIGYAQHPNQTYEFADDDPAEIDPRLVFKYLGIKSTVDERGQFRFIHRGAPAIKYLPKQTGAIGAAADALSALDSGGPGKDVTNAAVTPQDEENTTLVEFLEGGIFRIRDAEGQIIELDRVKKRIYLSNNDLKSTQSADGPGVLGNQFGSNSTPAEYLMLDKEKQLAIINARSIIQLYSFDRRKDVTEGNHQHKVGGDNKWIVGGDTNEEVEGNWTIEVEGDAKIEASGGAVMSLSDGKVGLGGPAGEVVDLMEQVLKQLDAFLTKLALETHPTAVGPSGPPTNAPDYVMIQIELKKIATAIGLIKGGI